MTLQKFQQLLKRINPNLRLRHRRTGDVVGLFVGYSDKSGYICRLSKENYTSMVLDYISKTNKGSSQVEYPNEAGRLSLTYSRNYRWINNHYQRSMLTHGIEYPDHLIKNLAGRDQYISKS